MANVKNYTEQGGEKTVIGGTLEFAEDAEVKGLPGATATAKGGVKLAAKVDAVVPAGQTATDCETKVNAILTALKNAGIMANS